MSTIVVVKKNGYAAIAADTLTKCGENKDAAAYVSNHSKILKIGESYLAIAGPTPAKLVLADFFSKLNPTPKLDKVADIFQTWSRIHKALKEDYFLCLNGEPEDYFESSHMDILIANPAGIFGVSTHRAVQEFTKFYAYGGGAMFALGAMHASYEDPDKSARDIASAAIHAASEFDDSTALPLLSYEMKLSKKEH